MLHNFPFPFPYFSVFFNLIMAFLFLVLLSIFHASVFGVSIFICLYLNLYTYTLIFFSSVSLQIYFVCLKHPIMFYRLFLSFSGFYLLSRIFGSSVLFLLYHFPSSLFSSKFVSF
jgi:hypothetical protein